MLRPLLASVLLLLAACARQPTDLESPVGGALRLDGLGLVTGTSFGFCVGYCRTELALDSPTVVFVERSNDGTLPVRTRALTLTPTDWKRIRSVVDLTALETAQGVHGCPDCADGGAEWIQISRPNELRVTFDYGAVLGPIAPLQLELRALRGRFPR